MRCQKSFISVSALDSVIDLELCILVFVHSLREADFSMYLDDLTVFVPWLDALGRTNYEG